MPDEIKKGKDIWEILEVISKFTTGFLLVVIAFVLDIGSKRIAQSNEESKIIQSLISDLTTKQAQSRNDVALLSLEKYLTAEDDSKNLQKNEAYITEVAEAILKQQEDASFTLESSIPFRVWNKYDSISANVFLTDYYQGKKDSSGVLRDSMKVTASELANIKPISQSKTAAEASVISSFNKKICYIQYNNKANASTVTNFQDTLKSTNWIAPGIDYVEGDYRNTVKYFNADDKVLADKAAATAKRIFNKDFQVTAILLSKFKVPKGQIEIWINNK